MQARQLALLLVAAEDASCDAGQPVSCQCDEPKNEHALTDELTEAGEGERAGGAATGALAARAVAEAAEGAAAAAAAAGGEGGDGAEAEAAAASAGRSRRFSAGAARRAIADRVAHAMGGKARNDAP